MRAVIHVLVILGSDEERCDLLAAYTRVRGDMNKIIEEVMVNGGGYWVHCYATSTFCSFLCLLTQLAHVDDEPRYREIIDAALKAGDIKPFAAYTKSVAPKER